MRTHTCACTHVHAHMRMHTCACTHAHAHMRMQRHMHMHMHAHLPQLTFMSAAISPSRKAAWWCCGTCISKYTMAIVGRHAYSSLCPYTTSNAMRSNLGRTVKVEAVGVLLSDEPSSPIDESWPSFDEPEMNGAESSGKVTLAWATRSPQ